MNVEKLKEFRAKLVKARDSATWEWKAIGPLWGVGLLRELQLKCQITISGRQINYIEFGNWCHSASLQTVRLMYDNSIAAIDARIAKEEK